ncbi:hypothetical protein LTR95_011176 [Oleoguttula sp. CCFEE 5521]
MAFSRWTREEAEARQSAYLKLDDEGRMIEDERSMSRGFLSVTDEIDFVKRNSSFDTTQSIQTEDTYTRRPLEEADVGFWKHRFGRQCGDVKCVDCVSAPADRSDARRAEASDGCTEATSRLCRICKHLDFAYLMGNFGGDRGITLGYLGDVVARGECAFCRLVTESIKSTYKGGALPLQDANGCRTEIGLETRTKDGNLSVFDLEIVFHPRQSAHYCDILIHRMASPADALPFCGRKVDPKTIDYALVQAWLEDCEHNVEGTGHDGAALPIKFDFAPSRLIDVSNCCVLRPTQSHYRYIALSYVWGGAQPLRLLLGNEEKLAAPNGLLTSGQRLPQTINDAMEITRRLGERYLWIDALCIVQDDFEFKQAELSLMSKIYSHALLTIFATHGNSVHAGLPGVSKVARYAPQHVEYVQNIALTNRLPTISTTVDQSVWNSRCWTFQERVLASRKLYITQHQVMFICPHTEVELCEDVYGPAIRPSEYMRSYGRDGDPDYRIVPHNPEGSIPPNCVNTEIYSSIVQQFCARQISFPADILDAFTGITNHLSILFDGPFLMGLPVNELDTQLLWRNIGPVERRICPDTGRDLFPSWSWAGWVGSCTGYVANALSSPAFELQCSDAETWTTMDQLRGTDFDATWQLHAADQSNFWQRGKQTAFYYAHPITPCENGTALIPVLREDEFGYAGILPIRTECIRLSITGATKLQDSGHSVSLTRLDLHFHRALPLFDQGNRVAGRAFIPSSVAETLEPGSYKFIKIATVATGYIDLIDGFLDWKSCYDHNLYGSSGKDSHDRIDGLLVRTVKGVSYRLGVAVCHATAFENANPKREVVLLG